MLLTTSGLIVYNGLTAQRHNGTTAQRHNVSTLTLTSTFFPLCHYDVKPLCLQFFIKSLYDNYNSLYIPYSCCINFARSENGMA